MVALTGQASAEEARAGSYASLIVRLRLGFDLSDGERAFLADFLEGKFKLEAHRPRSLNLPDEQYALARHVEYLEGGYQTDPVTGETRSSPIPKKAAVSLAMEYFNVSESTVRKAIRAAREKKSGVKRDW
jgi:hypothetical protein